MNVFRISACRHIHDLSGFGAYLFGGRWNSKGIHMLYTSSTSSLAMLEMIAHGIELKNHYCMIILDIPDDKIKTLPASDLPDKWFLFPAPDQLKAIGDNFILENKHLALIVPSAVNPQETNVLINPMHPEYKKVKLVGTETIVFDSRFAI